MKKLVLCEFAGRRKKVQFETESGKSDLSCLRHALLKASETDKDLRDRMANSTQIFQHIDLELCPQPIDIEENDTIEDKSILTIVFIPNTFTDLPVINLCGTSQERFLDFDIVNDQCDVDEDTQTISDSLTGSLNEASNKEDTATIQFSDVFTETSKVQSPEVTTETAKAKSSKVSAQVCEVNFLLKITCVLYLGS
ncbi:hypothetical protein X777_11739 [Ooceraea biroi]|uniref:Uncharacterized protein n=1 Tax=Ooceraea biroi TaxID=2015173 RepID=A0A026W1G4_OOCBI|nr:hypothetical protein X777_11739 [Ooceraea biroi]